MNGNDVCNLLVALCWFTPPHRHSAEAESGSSWDTEFPNSHVIRVPGSFLASAWPSRVCCRYLNQVFVCLPKKKIFFKENFAMFLRKANVDTYQSLEHIYLKARKKVRPESAALRGI